MSRTFALRLVSGRHFLGRSRLGVGLGLLCLACTASSSEVAPPRHDPYFPAALAVSPNEQHLFVLNTNADLRYDSGTLQTWDLDAVDALVEQVRAGQVPAGCVTDRIAPGAAHCATSQGDGAAPFVREAGAVRLGNFGASLAVQPLTQADGTSSSILRLFSTVRGDPSLTWVDFDQDAGTMDCGSTEAFGLCTDEHRLGTFFNDKSVGGLQLEPYGLFVDPVLDHALVSHLGTGEVTLAWAPPKVGVAPVLVDVVQGLFSQLTRRRAAGIAARTPGEPGLIYVTSASEAKVATVSIARGPEVDGVPRLRLTSGPAFHLSPRIPGGVPGDIRDVLFDANGDRAFLVSRAPNELVTVDTSLDATGLPRNEVSGGVEICRQVSEAAFAPADPAAGTPTQVLLPCFGIGQLWIVDVDGQLLTGTLDVGRGPTAVVVAPGRGRAYVANYGDDTIAVIDLDPASPLANRVVLRLGSDRGQEDKQ